MFALNIDWCQSQEIQIQNLYYEIEGESKLWFVCMNINKVIHVATLIYLFFNYNFIKFCQITVMT